MGNKQQTLRKDCGYRVLSIKPNSPLENQLQPFFDYIIDMKAQQSPKQILGKLTGEDPKHSSEKPFIARLKQQQGHKVILKVFSAKDRSLSEVEFIPNTKWAGENSNDLIGFTFRLEKFQDVQDNFCKITRIKNKSPISLANVQEGEYLIAVEQFKYENVTQLTDKLYERLYDPEVQDKKVHFVIYNVLRDNVRLVPIQLKRKWGGDGLLGCELSQGHLYKFPQNLTKYRQTLLGEEKKKEGLMAARKEMSNSDGAGKLLAQSLKRKTHHPKRRLIIKNPERTAELKEKLEEHLSQGYHDFRQPLQNGQSLEQRVWRLERTVATLQQVLFEPHQPQSLIQ